jgi:ubiquinone/menaquinone biosynthesis C-methylase UbiE
MATMKTAFANHDRDIEPTTNRSRWADAILRWRAREVLRKSQLQRHLGQARLLLDLGSGLGHITETMLRGAPGRSCVMMDPVHSVSPRVARRLAPFPCHAIKGNGMHLPFRDSTFDGAWAAFVLHHVRFEGQQTILGEIRRVLQPAAAFVLLEDTPGNAREAETTLRADRLLNSEPEEAPHHYRSPSEWRRDLPQHGFVIEREIAFTRLFPPATIRAVQHRAFVCRRR